VVRVARTFKHNVGLANRVRKILFCLLTVRLGGLFVCSPRRGVRKIAWTILHRIGWLPIGSDEISRPSHSLQGSVDQPHWRCANKISSWSYGPQNSNVAEPLYDHIDICKASIQFQNQRYIRYTQSSRHVRPSRKRKNFSLLDDRAALWIIRL
jgi:hypothetical protein